MLLTCAPRTFLLLVLHGSIAVPPMHLHSAPLGVHLYQVAVHAPFIVSLSSFVFGVVHCTVIATSRCNTVQPWPSMAENWESVSQGWVQVEVCASRKVCIELDDEIFKVVRTSVHFLLSLSQSQFYFRLLTVSHKPEAMQKPSQNLMSSSFCLRVRTVKCRDACQCLATVTVLDL